MYSAVMMPTEFDLYLLPCHSDLDLALALSRIYSPIRKPIWAIDDDVLPTNGDDVIRTLSSSRRVTSSFEENSQLSSMCLETCDDAKSNNEDASWFHPLIADDTTSGRCRTRPRDGAMTTEQPHPSRRTVIKRGVSLPGRITSYKMADTGSTSSRRRHLSNGVKFADEVGENLAMFSIIPSRFDDDHRNQLQHSWTTSTLPTGQCSPTGRRTTGTLYFRLFFEQPIADLTTFQRRLDDQSVSLENVKVIENPGVGHSASSLAVLCTAKVKHPVATSKDSRGRIADSRRVFARWTCDDWQSYADISAHCVNCSSVDRDADALTAANWVATQCVDTYSFGVQLKTTTSSSNDDFRRHVECNVCGGDDSGGQLEHHHPENAIEFALCYTADGKSTSWDNNNGKNYRIKWCYN